MMSLAHRFVGEPRTSFSIVDAASGILILREYGLSNGNPNLESLAHQRHVSSTNGPANSSKSDEAECYGLKMHATALVSNSLTTGSFVTMGRFFVA
jgi:hypothetical protein